MTHPPHEPDPALPPELTDALRELDGPAVLPSADHDAALLAAARTHLAAAGSPPADHRQRQRWHLFAWGAGGSAAAAAAAVAIAVWYGTYPTTTAGPALAQHRGAQSPTHSPGQSPEQPQGPAGAEAPAALLGDLDGSGTLDILDAFALARSLKAGGSASPDHDFNRDGTVDLHDADWLAAQAVSLRPDGGRG